MAGRWWSCYTQMGRVWGATTPDAWEAPGQELRMYQTRSITQHSRTVSPATAADIHCGRGVLCHRDTHPAKDSVQIKCQSTDMLRSSCLHRSKHNTFPRPQQHDSPPDCTPSRASLHLCLGPHSLPHFLVGSGTESPLCAWCTEPCQGPLGRTLGHTTRNSQCTRWSPARRLALICGSREPAPTPTTDYTLRKVTEGPSPTQQHPEATSHLPAGS